MPVGMTVLTNRDGILPLERGQPVALIGPHAIETIDMGGSSAQVPPPYHRQADGDVEMPGQLEQRPGGLGVVQWLQLGRGPPLLGGQVAERLLDPAELDLQGPDRILIGTHHPLPSLDAATTGSGLTGSSWAALAAR